MKVKRSERIAAITKILVEHPNVIFNLDYFSELFMAAKSTLSEDILTIKQTLDSFKLGIIETIPGAGGGVRYRACWENGKISRTLRDISQKLRDPGRVIPGGFIYMTDIIFSPSTAFNIGEIFATKFADKNPDYVITVETKGIPLAMMTARAMNVPLVIIRRDSRVTEGSAVSINYVSGSTGRIQTMSLARRAIRGGARVLIIDDFMKAGGTAKGILNLMGEFGADVVGIGVLVATREPLEKLVKDYLPLLILNSVDINTGTVDIVPNQNL